MPTNALRPLPTRPRRRGTGLMPRRALWAVSSPLSRGLFYGHLAEPCAADERSVVIGERGEFAVQFSERRLQRRECPPLAAVAGTRGLTIACPGPAGVCTRLPEGHA